ncbi:DUF805 domain-containing protein [Burkholderia cenocepacia]|uniref:DUF805 domain-containing protein n=1 Tax=Burkholderia cenocepacia TaxID=95486 RepID=UPI00163C3E53|nr:DUF805 domain-containing protein [Burkholderia cenocepacia]MDR8031413.1 DUF805 domain-containing protein [Burkholderia cenocepacia]MDR8040446.1 DUF805 domain-containing protein [Burkholderia cenocepacia]MDR8076214.1 DUF805 domain-containing protein [Burkholderia cenocepacia]
MIEWIKRRSTPRGRATRREYAATMFAIAFMLFVIKIFRLNWLGYEFLPNFIGFTAICFVIWVGVATQVRRLHDAGLSGNWAWPIFFVPFGAVVGMVFSLIAKPDQFKKSSMVQSHVATNPRE